jgi:hypothetical protein
MSLGGCFGLALEMNCDAVLQHGCLAIENTWAFKQD